jgi:hypothetical protein
MSLVERFADDTTLEYSLIDRMRIRLHVCNLQTITMLRTYFQQVRHVDWIVAVENEKAFRPAISALTARGIERFANRGGQGGRSRSRQFSPAVCPSLFSSPK